MDTAGRMAALLRALQLLASLLAYFVVVGWHAQERRRMLRWNIALLSLYVAQRRVHAKVLRRCWMLKRPQLRHKWKSLKKHYHKLVGDVGASGRSSKLPLTSPYFTPMHEILGGRPRSVSAQPGFGLESGESQHEYHTDNTNADNIEKVLPGDIDNEDYAILTPVDESSSFEEPAQCYSTPSSCSRPSTSNRIHGKSRASEQRRYRKQALEPYPGELRIIWNFIKDSEERCRRDQKEQMDRVLESLGVMANAITSSLQAQEKSEQN